MTKKSKMKERNNALIAEQKNNGFYIARGIAALLVILGHAVPFNSLVFRFIFCFHMPFFFILSGITTSLHHKEEEKFLPFLFKKFKTLLIPCFIIRVLFLVCQQVKITSWQELLIKIFWNNDPNAEWFLPTLFCSQILLFFVVKAIKAIKNASWRIFLFVFILAVIPSLLGGIQRSEFFTMLPFKADTLLISFSFMLIGFMLKKYSLHQEKTNPEHNAKKPSNFIIFAAAFSVYAIIHYTLNPVYSLPHGQFGENPIIFLFIATVMSLIVILLGIHLDGKLGVFEKTFTLLGRHSLFAYAAHLITFTIISTIIQKRFNMLIGPIYIEDEVLAALYFVGASVLIIIMLHIYDKIRRVIKKKN
ncbi:MAG: acyltransferase [Clostridia bacterium]|nr:acyltransferase [Clostridia bacterium]